MGNLINSGGKKMKDWVAVPRNYERKKNINKKTSRYEQYTHFNINIHHIHIYISHTLQLKRISVAMYIYFLTLTWPAQYITMCSSWRPCLKDKMLGHNTSTCTRYLWHTSVYPLLIRWAVFAGRWGILFFHLAALEIMTVGHEVNYEGSLASLETSLKISFKTM